MLVLRVSLEVLSLGSRKLFRLVWSFIFAFLCFRFGSSSLPEAPPTDVFTPSLVRRPPPSQTRNQKVKYNFCVFCKNNGEDESYYLSHTLKVWKSNKKIVGSSIPQTNFFFLVSVKNFLAFSFAESYKGKVKDPGQGTCKTERIQEFFA